MQPRPASSPGGAPRPGPGERVPMPAGPGSGRGRAGEKSVSRLGLAALAIFSAGLAVVIVFKGDFRKAQPAAPEVTAAVQVSVEAPRPKAPSVPSLSVAPPSEAPSLGTPGSPVETITPAPGFSSPLPFFNSEENEGVPKVSALQPYNNSPVPSQRSATSGTVLPAAGQLTPRLQPAAGGQAGLSRGLTAAASPGPCPSCEGAVPGTKTRANALQGGKTYQQDEISTTYMGLCEGKHVYDYVNLTTNMTIGMKVVTTGGEAWTFTLKPGQKTSLKSSTEFTSGTFEAYRISEVMN